MNEKIEGLNMFKKMVLSLLATATTLTASPKAVVFDFGGVMTKESNRESVIQFLRESFNLSEEEFKSVNQEKRKAVQNGQSDVEFWLNYAKKHHLNLPKDWVDNFNKVMKDAIGINPQMYALVETLKSDDITVALLSNIDERLGKLIRGYGFYEPFDPCLLSYELGVEKPDPQIYRYLLEKIELPASDILFIDDRLENVEAAKSLGFDAILFSSYEEVYQDLIIREVLQK